MTRVHPRMAVGVFAAAAILVAACHGPAATDTRSNSAAPTSASKPAAPAAAHDVEHAIGDVPWSDVGAGWMLAMWSPVKPHMPGADPAPGDPDPATATSVLYLVAPTGERYHLADFPASDGSPRLVDWSGNGTRALFTQTKDRDRYAVSLDLHTGQRTTIPVDGTPHYTRPNGESLMVSTQFNGSEPGTLVRLGLDGHQQIAYPTDGLGGAGQFSGDYLASPDGTQLVLGTANLGNQIVPRSDNSLVVMRNDGTIARTLPVPMPKAYCAPTKWWTPTTLLAHCTAEGTAAEQLWTVPIDGGPATALTAVNTHEDAPGFEGNYGNWTAYQTPSGTYLPTAGACGTTFVSRLTPDGHTERVNIVGARGSVGLIGPIGDKLAVVTQVGCGGGTALLSYNPATDVSSVLLGPPALDGGIDTVLPYPS